MCEIDRLLPWLSSGVMTTETTSASLSRACQSTGNTLLGCSAVGNDHDLGRRAPTGAQRDDVSPSDTILVIATSFPAFARSTWRCRRGRIRQGQHSAFGTHQSPVCRSTPKLPVRPEAGSGSAAAHRDKGREGPQFRADQSVVLIGIRRRAGAWRCQSADQWMFAFLIQNPIQNGVRSACKLDSARWIQELLLHEGRVTSILAA